MEQYVNIVLNQKGEGVILQKPYSIYEHGKSISVLKLKVLFLHFSIASINMWLSEIIIFAKTVLYTWQKTNRKSSDFPG